MPKRGRGRGGSREGGHGNKGRGGYIGAKSRKKRGGRGTRGGRGGRGGSRGGHSAPGEFPELMDLDNPDFISVSHPERTMKAAAARRGRMRYTLQNEAFETEDNRENTMKLPLRKRPVEFVKATTYDPSKDLVKKLREKEDYLKSIALKQDTNNSNIIDVTPDQETIKDSTEISELEDEDVVEIEIEAQTTNDLDEISESDSESETEEVDDEDGVDEENKKEDNDDLLPDAEENIVIIQPTTVSKPKDAISEIPDSQLFFVDNEGTEVHNVKVVDIEPLPVNVTKKKQIANNTEFTPTLSIGNVQLTTQETEDGQFTTLPKKTKRLKNLNSFDADQSIYELDDSDDSIYLKNAERPKDLYQSYNSYISNVMKNFMANNEDGSDDEGDDDDDAEDLEDQDDDQDDEAEKKFIESMGFESEDDDDDEQLLDETNPEQDFKRLKLSETSQEQEEPSEPEYGFLPEDYETFDNSLVDVINIRYGSSSNQYFMKSFSLTGSYDFEWIDQELFTDFLLEHGMPEHRLNAYFKYITAQLTPEEVEEPDYDIEFSDSSEEEEDTYDERQDPLSDSDNEGLEDLINYTTKYNGVRDQEYTPTQSLKTRGKGRKKELVLDHIADDDLRNSLNEQYQIRRDGKKQRKADKESNKNKANASSNDLSLKYPYSFHVKDIKTEFESFFLDQKRNALTFPPMDIHAIKTIGKFAYYYNMKSRKFGQGLKMHAVVIKNKRTFRSIPDYHSVAQLMKQRRVFNRIDQKRPRSEVEHEEAKSSRRGNPSKAHVKEGDIVGANAPEISSDNIGRRLLVKMGWSAGEGLGLDNRGVPEPVIAKVKKTKLGIR